ncbi:glycosyltransferase [Ilyomonas limi]|uniref:Glycosyltransferase n=1 Tax=Ilyomonas limi TaxID=2575867 RepID=A0A4U3KXY9_9BACT|nr:glycosyltransferase [Ilyomonas limi]TKK67242.1 glycosyltransferase [Ilyomonas limi]
MPLLYILCSLLCAVYCSIIIAYRVWFKKLQPFQPTDAPDQYQSFSVIIPARNEAANITNCLQSIITNNYPQAFFEIIVIDDFSTDNTPECVRKMQQQYSNIQLLSLEAMIGKRSMLAYKKKAIELAIEQAKSNWIVTTDADCIVPKNWLSNLNNYIHQTNAVFVAAPVSFINTHSFISLFQCLDFMSLQGITAAAVSAGVHSMCNGANLAYSKAIFYAVDGFKDIDTIASGDDMLLMGKIQKQYTGKTGYLFNNNSIVQTLPMPTWKDFINQRIRWASKTGKYQDGKIIAVLALVYLFNLSLLVLFFSCFLVPKLFIFWLLLLIIKTVCELSFIIPVARFFKQEKLLIWFPVMQPFHIVYTVVAGWLGLFGKYQWKDRKVK